MIILILVLILLFILFYTRKENLYNGEKWKKYRIGDVYKLFRKNDIKYHLKDFPDSIASEYIKNTNHKKNEKVLNEIINKRNNGEMMGNSDMALHVRVGDVLCKHSGKYLNYSRKGDTLWWGSLINYMKNNKIKNVYIISGAHTKDCLKMSEDYLKDIKRFLEKNGFNVIFRLGQSPDEDIIFCYKFKYYASTNGGYGRLIKQMVEMRGGNVFKF